MPHEGDSDTLDDGLGTYGEQGGHHPMAKKAFEGVEGYDPDEAIIISNEKLEELGVRHSTITGNQHSLYNEFAKTGKTLTMEDMRTIEIKALTKSGVPEDYATNAVDMAIQDLLNKRITQPINIPWN